MQVLDTSVIYKWYVEEEGSSQALKLFNDFKKGEMEISIPELVFYELANALRFNPKNTEKDVEEVIENLANLGLNIVVVTTGLLRDSVKFAYKYNITIYDAVFLALAKDLNFEFITADENLFRKTKSLDFVRFLKNFF